MVQISTIRCWGHELTIHQITRSMLVFVADCRDLKLATTPSPAQTFTFHDPPHSAVCDVGTAARLVDLSGWRRLFAMKWQDLAQGQSGARLAVRDS